MTRQLTVSGFSIALGLILPMLFHLAGGMGVVFLPMHLPVLLAGFFLGPRFGLLVGIITPLLSSLLTGMPPLLPFLPLMVVELGVYGFLSGYGYRSLQLSILPALLLAMAGGRIALAAWAWALVSCFGLQLQPRYYVTAAVITGLPGIVLQLVLVPLLVRTVTAKNSSG